MNFDLSELEALDRAFGTHILSAYAAMDKNAGPWHFRQFMEKPDNQRVYRGEYDDPKTFIDSLRSYLKQTQKEGDRVYNQAVLPAVYYYRTLDMATSEPDAGNVVADQVLWTADGTQSLSISMARLNLTYKLVFVAPDKATVQRLLLAWYFHISNTRQGGHRIPVTYEIAGEPLELSAQIIDPQTLGATNISLPKNEERLFAVECEYEITAPVLYGQQISVPDCIRYTVELVPWMVGVDCGC